MKKIMCFFVKLVALLCYFPTYLIPRKKKRWVFGEAHGFSNNSKYFFLEVLQEHPEIEAYWIGSRDTVRQLRRQSLPVHYRYSPKGIYLCLTAKVYVVSWLPGDICFYFSGGATIVNLWHGVGFKKILWLNSSNLLAETSLYRKVIHFIYRPQLYFHPSIVLSTSPFYTEYVFTKCFRVPKENCVEDIYPRVKFMLKEKDEILGYLQKHAYTQQYDFNASLSAYSRVILYAPTFRDTGKDFIADSGINFNELNEIMQRQNALFIVKLHPSTRYDSKTYHGLTNIRFLDRTYDLYTTMPFTDILITDYSSILADYLLLGKKIIAFPFDYEQYVTECRELQFDYFTCIEGIPVARNYEQLKHLLISEVPPASQTSINRYWQPSENLYERIINVIYR